MTEPDPLVGQVVLGRYRILRLLGEGGMGVVYEAEHTLIEKRIALKVLRAAYSNQQELVARFQREAISASRIKHPNILDVFDFGQMEDGSFYLAMEFLEGHDLADELSKNGILSPERGIRLAMQICRALAAAHARGVVHRDLKPENIFLCRVGESDETVKIVDFGIARLRGRESMPDREDGPHRRLTKTGMIFGTPEYMSPEQARGAEADVRSDVYAVGILLFEMFCGAVPFRGETFMSVLTAHLLEPLPSMRQIHPGLAISVELEQVIYRALEKDPSLRTQSMGELAHALRATPEGSVLRDATPVPVVRASAAPPAGDLPEESVPHLPPPSRPFGHKEDSTRQTLVESFPDSSATDSAPGSQLTVPRREGGPLLWIVLGLSLPLVAGAAAVLSGLWRPMGEPLPAPATTTVVTVVQTALPPPPPSAPASATPDQDAGPTPPKVKLTVESHPPGAVILRDGFQVCDAAPCVIEAAPEEKLELTAARGGARGVARVIAQKDQKVDIWMPAARPGTGPASSATKPNPGGSGALCEVEVDGLKLLRPCK